MRTRDKPACTLYKQLQSKQSKLSTLVRPRQFWCRLPILFRNQSLPYHLHGCRITLHRIAVVHFLPMLLRALWLVCCNLSSGPMPRAQNFLQQLSPYTTLTPVHHSAWKHLAC